MFEMLQDSNKQLKQQLATLLADDFVKEMIDAKNKKFEKSFEYMIFEAI